MRSKPLLVLAAVLAIAGGVLYAFPGDGEVTFGWVSSGPSGDEITLPAILFLTTRRVIGMVLLWVASLLVAGVVGARFAQSRLLSK